jgi:raffinose/stachyose/melibiose transport system substrate-binding protein
MKTRRWVGLVAAVTVLATAGCNGTGSKAGSAAAPTDPAKVSGDITVLTNRTDLASDGTLDKYAAEFNKTYPNVHVKFQGITNYESDVKIRLNSSNYGDVLLIPSALQHSEYPTFFASLGSQADLDAKYRFVANGAYNGQVYGVAQNGNANGFVYNKAVWAAAGVTAWPKTPEEFLADLQAIKTKTQATPYYTNYHDGWPVSSFEGAVGSVSCDPKANDNLATESTPWAQGKELNTIDSVLYNMVNKKLTEADPTTTNWENSKTLIATRKIATMFLGSWAIVQMQQAATKAGTKPDDIGFMPWPAQKDGKFCPVIGPDYLQAVSLKSAHRDAARAWLDWFTDKSTYAQDNGDVPTLKSATLPASIKPLQDAGSTFVELTQDKVAVVNNIDNAAEIGLTKPDYRQKIVDIARGAASGTLDGDFADLDKKWGDALKTAGS